MTQSIATPEAVSRSRRSCPRHAILCRMGILDVKAAVDTEWDKLEQLPKVKGTKRGKDNTFCYADGLLPPQEFGIGAEVQKKQGASCSNCQFDPVNLDPMIQVKHVNTTTNSLTL